MKVTIEKLNKAVLFIGIIAFAIFIIACSDSTSPSSGQGQITVTMVDAPAVYGQVNIAVTRVEVHKAGSDSTSGWVVVNNTAAMYDLLKLQNGANAVIGDGSLDAGHYTQIRLIIGTGSNIVVNGVIFNLTIPGGIQTGIKLNQEFDIQSGQVYSLMLDFNADHSIVSTGNGLYKLSPVIRVVPTIISGTISGTVTPIAALASVYAITGTDTVKAVPDITNGSFKLMALVQGTYIVKVSAGNPIYNNTSISGVTVVAKQNTDLGTINLSLK